MKKLIRFSIAITGSAFVFISPAFAEWTNVGRTNRIAPQAVDKCDFRLKLIQNNEPAPEFMNLYVNLTTSGNYFVRDGSGKLVLQQQMLGAVPRELTSHFSKFILESDRSEEDKQYMIDHLDDTFPEAGLFTQKPVTPSAPEIGAFFRNSAYQLTLNPRRAVLQRNCK